MKGQKSNTESDNIQLRITKDIKKKSNAVCIVKNTSISQVVRDYLESWSEREIKKFNEQQLQKYLEELNKK